MAGLATRRLIDAAAKLDPADRALLNLWVNRGLDDERLTELTGLSIEALHVRREKIVAELAADLGLPDEDVRAALDQISPDDEALSPPAPDGVTATAPSPNGAVTATAPGAPPSDADAPPHEADASPPDPEAPPPAAETPRSGRRLWGGLLALVLTAAVVIAIIAGGGRSSPAPHPAAGTPSTATPSTRTPPGPTPAHPATGSPVPPPLAALPGGLTHASGSIKLSGKLKNLRLSLTVRGLPAAHAGHYEVWLYNSVIDSQPLGRLRNGHHRLTVHLPSHVRHYRWIDISFQPVGAINHSGESELRASNPAHTTMARLRKHSSRTRHRLRQAARVSAAHPARPPKRHRATNPPPARNRAGGHRPKRVTKGSSRAKTSK